MRRAVQSAFLAALVTVYAVPDTRADWTPVASMPSPRYAPRALLMPDGRILVSGYVVNGATTALTVFDPRSGSWSDVPVPESPAGPFPGASGTLALLDTGDVLVSGGGSNAVPDAWLYAPFDPGWTKTGGMIASGERGRIGHTATRLNSGSVLVTGGYWYYKGGAFNATELYDPASGTWSSTGTMHEPRTGHTATLLRSGEVLVVGGRGAPDTSAFLYGLSYVFLSTELFDPRTSSWRLAAPAGSRVGHTATLLPSGRVLVAGGVEDHLDQYLHLSVTPLATAEIYDPVADTWSPTGSLATARQGHQATLLSSGKVLVTGGGPAEIYDEATGAWMDASAGASSAGVAQFSAATLLPSGQVLVVHGDGSAELFDEGFKGTAAWTPSINAVPPNVPQGGKLILGGSGFTGISEGAGGGTASSPTNFPLVEIRSASGQSQFLPLTHFDAGSVEATIPGELALGEHTVRVIVSGVPSAAFAVTITTKPSSGCSTAGDGGLLIAMALWLATRRRGRRPQPGAISVARTLAPRSRRRDNESGAGARDCQGRWRVRAHRCGREARPSWRVNIGSFEGLANPECAPAM